MSFEPGVLFFVLGIAGGLTIVLIGIPRYWWMANFVHRPGGLT